MVAVMSTVLLMVAALAVDLGMQRVLRRDLQALADVVALDLARELDGRGRSALLPEMDPNLSTSALAHSVARNASVLGDPPVVTADLGSWDGTTFDLTADPPTAVRVTARGAVDFAFRNGEGGATRTAVGTTIKSACFAVGSFAARFRSGDSALIATLVEPLDELLRPQSNLDAVSYTGLASAHLTLSELAAGAGLGSTEQLLTSSLTAGDLVSAAISVLGRDATANSVAISALNKLLNGRGDLDTPILLTDVVRVSPADSAAMQTELSVLDLVAGAILVADGDTGFQLGNGNLGTQIGGVASLNRAQVALIQRPNIACGPFGSAESEAWSSQIRGQADAKLELPTINLGGGDIVQTSPATVTLAVDMGNATARLAGDPTCGAGSPADPDRLTVDAATALSTYTLTTTLSFRTRLRIAGANVDVTWSQAAGAGQSMPAASETAALTVPPHDLNPYETGAGSAGLVGATVGTAVTNVTATTKVGNVTVGVPINTVLPALAPIATQLAVHPTVDGRLDSLATNIDAALNPLFTLLGLNVSGADLYSVGRPLCAAPVLRG